MAVLPVISTFAACQVTQAMNALERAINALALRSNCTAYTAPSRCLVPIKARCCVSLTYCFHINFPEIVSSKNGAACQHERDIIRTALQDAHAQTKHADKHARHVMHAAFGKHVCHRNAAFFIRIIISVGNQCGNTV